MSEAKQRCGFIAIVGRPNVGKSTLLNHLLGQKISITSRKPQTTRNNIIGIKTQAEKQFVFVDTPGIHQGQYKAINTYMNKAALSALQGNDIVVFVLDQDFWTNEDEHVLQQVIQSKLPLVIAINKIDKLEDKNILLPYLRKIHQKLSAASVEKFEIIPLAALKDYNLGRFEQLLSNWLPYGEHFYEEDQITDRSLRFMCAEIIREKVTRQLGAELPYSMAVEIEKFEERVKLTTIHALILVEREGQKRILIGDKGEKIKLIGQQARLDIEKLVENKVMLKLWVKVKSGWSDDSHALKSLGYS